MATNYRVEKGQGADDLEPGEHAHLNAIDNAEMREARRVRPQVDMQATAARDYLGFLSKIKVSPQTYWCGDCQDPIIRKITYHETDGGTLFHRSKDGQPTHYKHLPGPKRCYRCAATEWQRLTRLKGLH